MNDQEKINAARREYAKAWRAANKDKVREYQNRWWMKRFEKAEATKTAEASDR